jgi:hypothetical protein
MMFLLHGQLQPGNCREHCNSRAACQNQNYTAQQHSPNKSRAAEPISHQARRKAFVDSLTGDGRREHTVADHHAGAHQRQHEQHTLQHLVPLQQPPDAGSSAPAQRHCIAVLRRSLLGATVGSVQELVLVPGGGSSWREERGARVAAEEGVEREGASFAVVVGAEDDADVLEERDERERPEDEGEHAEDLLVALRVLDVLRERRLVHVQRRRAEVAVNHAKALVRQAQRHPPWHPVPSSPLLLLRAQHSHTNKRNQHISGPEPSKIARKPTDKGILRFRSHGDGEQEPPDKIGPSKHQATPVHHTSSSGGVPGSGGDGGASGSMTGGLFIAASTAR